MPPVEPARPAICLVVHGLPVGGTEVLVSRLVRQLGSRFRFVVACLDQLGTLGQQLVDQGVPVHVLGRGQGLDWRCAVRLRKLLRDNAIQLIHAHQYTPFVYSAAARIGCWRLPLLFTEHGRFHPDYPRPKRMLFNRAVLRKGDRCIAVGNAVRDALIVNEGFPGSRVEVIYNGVDLAPHLSADKTRCRNEIRNELGLSAEQFVVAQVARLDSIKDHVTAIRAIQRVTAGNREATLLIVGDGPERAVIEQAIQERGLAHSVRMLGMRQDVQRILAASDVFLLTSLSEGIPLTVIEAMAAGLPVVTTDVGGLREVVDESTAILAGVGDDEALAGALTCLLGNSELRQRLGAAGRQRAISEFSEEKNHSVYGRLYEEMIGQNNQALSTKH